MCNPGKNDSARNIVTKIRLLDAKLKQEISMNSAPPVSRPGFNAPHDAGL